MAPVTPLRAGLLLVAAGLGLLAVMAYTFFPAPTARFELPMQDGKTNAVWICTQPGTLAEAEARAKAAHPQMMSQTRDLATRAATEIQQAIQTANANGTIPTEIEDIYDRLKADSEAILTAIEAEFGCRAQSLTTP